VFRKSLRVILIAVSVFYANVIVGYCAGITIGAGASMTLSGSPTITTNGNWSNQGTFTAGTSTVNFTGGSGVTQTLNSGGTGVGKFFYHLIHSGAGTLQLVTNPIDIDGNFTNSAGTFDAGGFTMYCTGTWSNTATFTHGNNSVILDGGSQTINGSTTFYNFTKNVTTAATLTFDHLGTQTIVNSLTLNGASLQLLSLRSDSATVAFKIILQFGGVQSLSYLDVLRSDASGGSTLVAGTTSTDSGSNTNWLFAAPVLSVSVLPATYGFGPVIEGSTNVATSAITVTNNGNVVETYQLKLTNPTGWTAIQTGTPGIDHYMLSAMFHGATAPVAADFADNDALSTAYQTCSATVFAKDTSPPETGVGVPVGAERRLWFRFTAPSYSNVGTEQSIVVTINATAA